MPSDGIPQQPQPNGSPSKARPMGRSFSSLQRLMMDQSRSDRIAVRAEIARAGLHSLSGRDDPEFGWIDPMDDPDTKVLLQRLVAALWHGSEYE